MSRHPEVQEHDGEDVPGLPGPLPKGENILWQGAPEWQGIARRALFVRGIAIYFILLAVLRGGDLTSQGAGAMEAVAEGLLLVVIGAVPVALLLLFAGLSARTSLYTITTRRIVMRVGVALPMTINIPFVLIDKADVAKHADGTGDVMVTLAKPHRVSWLALWPHIRPFRISHPQPMLRALKDADVAAQVLSRALAAAASVPVPAVAASGEARKPGHAEAMA
ncbi:photosynthetic complex putative assembly protein PuhB [Falsiroseomonas sp.]|uniref:photosynthetic complex putative assembly protein PuhB n=1 Tax=Falsiroseomonas sp. TaxID=2870721 RepID=UPI002735923B|nr:photosynthetic complex putative assembly protein PuhB [Falsiroseomonas sp.]MDP3416218.1 photosynthetic complex putative assembly protein PuhB [Falsiroseomonas sp.]